MNNLNSTINHIKNMFFSIASINGIPTIEMINLVRNIKHFFNYVSFESINGQVLIGTVTNESIKNTQLNKIDCMDELLYFYSKENRNNDICLFVDEEEQIWSSILDIEQIEKLQLEGNFYKLTSDKKEFITHNNVTIQLTQPDNKKSCFTNLDFEFLRCQLKAYKDESARKSTCMLLNDAWHNPKDRKEFKSRPEHYMRDSLTQFLKNVFTRRAVVHPEQNVDDSHPVDIKVTFKNTNRTAILEVKWLGDSISNSGKKIKYRDARAKEGAKQLNDYLDKISSHEPQNETRGYLIVFDARRKDEDLFFYQNKEIEYDPKYDEIRPDFDEPLRFFIEPILTTSS
ncbi:hypothetical protein [Thiomicrospira sp. WB1]|uniref:hypothetical protein n=1 Tax=Thiomicrospira sp. WB1 TaxID=1685380 RepID=UPI0007476A6D|nr:hypothetical protein [Thiomicrospira sp. WB1]KUJ71541.1 hypothetical protein AVO41_08475 [Thiomicrospira sp. WB1]